MHFYYPPKKKSGDKQPCLSPDYILFLNLYQFSL